MNSQTSEYKICQKTVIDTTIPGTTFDDAGVCNQYWDFQNVVKPNWHPNEVGKQKLDREIELIKQQGRDNEFDCLLGLSGGIDSSYLLHKMVQEYGLRPLVFHVDAGWNSELAVHNVQALVDKLGLDLYTEVINWEEMRDFQLAFFKSGVPHIDIPQDHAFVSVLYKFAEKHNIKTILNGGNISTECVKMPLDYYYWGTDMTHIRHIIREFGTVPMQTYPFSSVYNHKIYLKYFKGIKVYKPLNLMPYSKESAVDLLKSEFGWKPYPQKHFESRFTRFYEGYWLPKRFGFDVRKCQLSSLILTDQMTREEALSILDKPPFDSDEIHQDIEYIASKLRISSEELIGYRDMPKKFYSDYKNENWFLGAIEYAMTVTKLGRRGGAY